MYTTITILKEKPEKHTELVVVLRSVMNEFPLANGCENVRVLQHSNDATSFTLIEDWHDQKKISSLSKKLVEAGIWGQLETMLREPLIRQQLIDL